MAKTYPFPIRLTADEKEKLRELADLEYRKMADWVRARINMEHDKLTEANKATEISAN